jgi:hypothetical protein
MNAACSGITRSSMLQVSFWAPKPRLQGRLRYAQECVRE